MILWEDGLIGQFHGSAPHRNQIQAIVSTLWGRQGKVDVLELQNESIFKFENKQTNWVLDSDPWIILQKPLFLKKWEPGPVEKLSIQKFPLWVRLWDALIEPYTADGISCIASATAYPLYMDKATEERRRIPLPDYVWKLTGRIGSQILLKLILRELGKLQLK